MVVLAKEIPSLHGNLRNLHFFTGTTHIWGALNLHFSYFGGPRAETNIFAPENGWLEYGRLVLGFQNRHTKFKYIV